MSRSRSSFDLAGAIASATSLAVEDEAAPRFRGVALVSFGAQPPPLPIVVAVAVPPPPPDMPPSNPEPSVPTPRVSLAGPPEHSSLEDSIITDSARRPPKLPDLSLVPSPTERCQKIIDWVAEATGATDVFIADASGLPIAGATDDAESRLASFGMVAACITQLAASIPGTASSLFELHVGEGPFFQLVGFHVDESLYLVGFHRATPLSYRQAHAVRLACRHALGSAGGAA